MEIKISSNLNFPIRNYSNLKANSGSITSKNAIQTFKKNVIFDNNNSLNSTAFTSKILKKNNSVNSQKEFKNKNGNDEKKIKDTIFQLSIWDSEHLENLNLKM